MQNTCEHDAKWQCMHGYSACDTTTNLIGAQKTHSRHWQQSKKKESVMDHRDQVQIRLPKRSPGKSGRAKTRNKKTQWFPK